jgi:hypothetical protein
MARASLAMTRGSGDIFRRQRCEHACSICWTSRGRRSASRSQPCSAARHGTQCASVPPTCAVHRGSHGRARSINLTLAGPRQARMTRAIDPSPNGRRLRRRHRHEHRGLNPFSPAGKSARAAAVSPPSKTGVVSGVRKRQGHGAPDACAACRTAHTLFRPW